MKEKRKKMKKKKKKKRRDKKAIITGIIVLESSDSKCIYTTKKNCNHIAQVSSVQDPRQQKNVWAENKVPPSAHTLAVAFFLNYFGGHHGRRSSLDHSEGR